MDGNALKWWITYSPSPCLDMMTMHGGNYRSTLFVRPVVYRFLVIWVCYTLKITYFPFLSATKGQTDDILVCIETPRVFFL